jgi:hypothetical protein
VGPIFNCSIGNHFIFFIGPTYKNPSHFKWDPLFIHFNGTQFKNTRFQLGPTFSIFPYDPLIKIHHISNWTHFLYIFIRPTYRKSLNFYWDPLIKIHHISNGTHFLYIFIRPTYRNPSDFNWDPRLSFFIGPTYKNPSFQMGPTFYIFSYDPLIEIHQISIGTHFLYFSIGPTYKYPSHFKWDPLL